MVLLLAGGTYIKLPPCNNDTSFLYWHLSPLYSVPIPFKGDYQNLLANPKWKKLQSQMPQDSHIVFADVVQKIHRANGKVN